MLKQDINKDPDPSLAMFECQLGNCDNKRQRRFMHSFIFSYLTPGVELHEDGETIKKLYPGFDHEQLWFCSHDHMLRGLHAYIEMLEEGAHYAPTPEEIKQQWLQQ